MTSTPLIPDRRSTAGGVLALVPARGGSKGIVGKNLRLLDGHPLVAWAIAAGVEAVEVDRVICSTDDEAIAAAARSYGADVPFMRPVELAQDDTRDLPVFLHALDWLRDHEGWEPAIVVHLRPTTPLRTEGLVDRSIQLLHSDPAASSVRSVCAPPVTPFKMWRVAGAGESPYLQPLLDVPGVVEPYNAPRQSLPSTWWHCGVLDTIRTSVLRGGSMSGSSILPLPVEAALAVDIDEAQDLVRAEALVKDAQTVRPGPSVNWSGIRLLVVDVDGTLTSGDIFYGPEGEELKRFHTHDGKGIRALQDAGIEVAIITQESTRFTLSRARKLAITEVHIGIEDKAAVLVEMTERLGIPLSAVAYVGDDIGDLSAFRLVTEHGGIACAVADARPEILASSTFVTHRLGGYGAVRDVCDEICNATISAKP